MARRPPTRRQTAREAAHYNYMSDVMKRLEWDLHNTIALTNREPMAWHEIAAAEKRSATVKVNLRLEADVVKFLKSMGEGWGPRANDILKTYMHARIASVVKGAETLDIWRAREGEHDGPKPGFGRTAELFGETDETTGEHSLSATVRMLEMLQRRYAEEGEPENGLPQVRVK